MNIFDGKYRSKPQINLAGASRVKSREELIVEVTKERQKREREKKEAAAALKIQSNYRSYLERKRFKLECRKEFDQLFSDTARFEANLNSILSNFVNMYDDKLDADRLIKFSQSMLKSKGTIVKHLQTCVIQDSFVYSFARFLVINLKSLNRTTAANAANASLFPLRALDFTDLKNYTNGKPPTTLLFIFNFLLKRGYINELTKFAILKIPPNATKDSKIPVVQNISEYIYRPFLYITPEPETNLAIQLNENIVNAFCNELFNKANVSQIRHCIIENVSKQFEENFARSGETWHKKCCSEFLAVFTRFFTKATATPPIVIDPHLLSPTKAHSALQQIFSFVDYKKNILVMFCLLKIFQYALKDLSTLQLNEFLRVLRSMIAKMPLFNSADELNEMALAVSTRTSSVDKGNNSAADDSGQMELDRLIEADEELMETGCGDGATEDDNDTKRGLIDEVIAIFESKEFTANIEHFLETHARNNPNIDQAAQPPATASSISYLSSDPIIQEFCFSLSHICNFILLKSKLKYYQSQLLRTIAFNKFFLANLWRTVCTMSIKTSHKQDLYLIQLLVSGTCTEFYDNDLYQIVAPLSTFCSLYNLFLLPILDEEFLKGQAIFSKEELIKICATLKDICLGIIRLMHPDSFSLASLASLEKGAIVYNDGGIEKSSSVDSTSGDEKQYYRRRSPGGNSAKNRASAEMKMKAIYFTHLFQLCSQLVQRMHTRDIRYGFCPEDHWVSNNISVTATRIKAIFHTQDVTILTSIKFGQLSYLFQQEDTDNEHKLSVHDVRSMTVLQELPFTVPFKERVEIMEHFIALEPSYSHHNRLSLRVRRDFLYEDAFEKLSSENAPNLKASRIVIEMINQLGVDEAGVDGGGLFREFMLTLLETGFDPIRGFFKLTSDGFIYPNPDVKMIYPDNFAKHYFFLGRVLAKAIQTKILSQVKFAGFFLQKILSKTNDSRLDIDYLASLDAEVYKNLLYLKTVRNVEDIGLTFTVDTDEFGEAKSVELKPDGRNCVVTNDNRIEYIHLLADFKLNRQIHEQVLAFRAGLSDVIDLELLRLFNFNELQNLVSGTKDIIDVEDWRRYTVYQGDYFGGHPVIETFWLVVDGLSEEHKRKLLKFVTSRSRPPLFGFRNLIPQFAILPSGSDRLPTSSTCLNLLKLPPINDYHTLRDKLICAIESEAGFDLS